MNRDFANLNTLRAAAVSAVLMNHLFFILTTRHIASQALFGVGHVGVLAFFVHTSLVLMFSLERLPEHRRTINFYLRRAFRIYPLAIVCIIAALLVRIPASPMEGPYYDPPSRAVVVGNLFLIQNIFGRKSVVAPLWSLPFEVQMYVVLPFLWQLARKSKARRLLSLLFVGFSFLGFITQYFTGHANLLAFIPCFLSGILAYSFRDRKPFLPAGGWPLFVVTWIAVASWGEKLPNNLDLPATWCATLLLGYCIFLFRDSTTYWFNHVTGGIAKYSYGIYLAHIPVMWLVFYKLPWHNTITQIALWLIGTAGVSVGAYHLLEEPMIGAGKSISALIAGARQSTGSAPLSGVCPVALSSNVTP